MQKISRIYLGNCGYHGAWYDGMTLDLTDPDTDLPTDTVFNLENGGGKTSLLSLIFSCFETSQDRFLKHIQSKNHHFSQYFSSDGLPGVVLVEWLMPARSSSSGPYRLVVGQVVSIKAGAEQQESDRMFFSFEARQSLEFTDIPAPKLGAMPVTTMAEFSRWIHDEQKKHPGNVYITRKQADWQRHLKDQCLIDLEMLQMQVNFSAVEGGFDAGFLNFTNESEFLRKFFHLTLDPDQTRAVRDAVASTCDKLSRKPHFERRLAELTKLLGVLEKFHEAALAHRTAQADQSGVLIDGACIAVALQKRAVQRKNQGKDELIFAVEQRNVATGALADSAAHFKDELTLNSLLLTKRVFRTQRDKQEADERFKAIETKIRHVKAARLQQGIHTEEERVNHLEALHLLALDDLKPFQEHAEIQGALLRRILYAEEQRLRAKIVTLELNAAARIAQLATNKAALDQLVLDDRQAVQKNAMLMTAEENARNRKAKLLKDAFYQDEVETTVAATVRWAGLAGQARIEKSNFDLEKANLDRLARESQQLAKDEGLEAVVLTGQMETKSIFIVEGEAEREKLSQLPALTQAAQADLVDPDSPALIPLLERVVASSAQEVSFSDVRLAEFNANRQAIDETGVSGHSPDVALVVAWLLKAGVCSARPFNEYIAQALPDVGKARALVLSDPARFFGVSVAASEMADVRALDWKEVRPTRPVLISPVALEPLDGSSPAFVVPSDNDAAYNVSAAVVLGETLLARIVKEQGLKNTYAERQSEAITALGRLRAFMLKFGEGILGKVQEEVATLREEREITKGREAEAVQRAEQFNESAKLKEAEAKAKESEARTADQNARTLQQFWDEQEAGSAARQEQLADLVGVFEDIEGKKLGLEESSLALTEAGRTEFEAKVMQESVANGLFTELGTVMYYDKNYDAKRHLTNYPADLGTLRKTYEDARSAFDTEATSQLGVVKEKLDSARKAKEEKMREFTRDYSGVKASDMQAFAGLDHTAMLPGLDTDLNEAHLSQVNATADFNTVTKAAGDWHRVNKNIQLATPEMESLSEAELQARQDTALQLKEKSQAAMRNANDAADGAKAKAAELGDQAQADEQLAKLLITSLSLPENPDPELIRLEYASLMFASATEEVLAAEPLVLALQANEQVNSLVRTYKGKEKGIETAGGKAHDAFDRLKSAAAEKVLQEVEQELASQMLANNFDAACADSTRLLEGLEDRIETTRSNLERMSADFEVCVEELMAVTHQGLRVLNSATSSNKRVPVGAQYVGGKQILKMSARFSELSNDAKRQSVRHYLDSLIDTNIIPAKGADLVAESVLRQHGGKPLGLKVLKMVVDESMQYVVIDKISNSGGEGVVMAMFLYLLITQLRAETQAKLKKAGGGPLILDNPFAKATSPAMWKAQRLLAEAMGVQLIFATALQDYNTVGEFQRFIRLRKVGQNSKTGRWHLEAVDFQLAERIVEAA